MATQQGKPPILPLQEERRGVPGVSPAHELLVGRVVIEWAKVDAMINDIIWHLIGLEMDDGRVFTERLDSNRLIGIARVFCNRKLQDPIKSQLLSALEYADALREDRNFIVHGTWGTLMPDNVPVALSLRAKSSLGTIISETFPAERMRYIVQEIQRTQAKLSAVVSALPLPSHGKSL